MTIWRCEICGDPYLGEQKPSDCPFCGAPGRFITIQESFINNISKIKELSDVSKKNLETAIELEINATKVYQSAAGIAENDEIRNFFKAIAKHEYEHVSLLCKALGIAKPVIDNSQTASSEKEAIIDTIKLENNATTLYAKFLSEATEARVREIFIALIAVENSHFTKASQLLSSF